MIVPTLQQLKSVQLRYKADVNIHAWQGLMNLLLQASLPEGVVEQLLLLPLRGRPALLFHAHDWSHPAGSLPALNTVCSQNPSAFCSSHLDYCVFCSS